MAPTMPTTAASPAPSIGMPDGPGDPVPSDVLFFVTQDVRRGMEQLITGLENGAFDEARPGHLDEARDLLTRATELQSRDGIVTFGELDSVFFAYEDLHVELTGQYPIPGGFVDLEPVTGPSIPTPDPIDDVDLDAPTTPAATTPTPVDEPVETSVLATPTTQPALTAIAPAAPATIAATPATIAATPATIAAIPVATQPATTIPDSTITTVAPVVRNAPATPTVTQPAGTISTDRLISILLGVLGLTAILAVAGYLFDRWRRRRLPVASGRPGFHDLLDVSRRLAAAGTVDEVEIMAVRQAMRLTDADAGAFVRRGDRIASVSYETSDGLLVPDRLNEGALDRVLAAGHELMQTTSVEPAIRHVPVSLLAMPTFNAGAVFGAIVLLRDADNPFGADETRMASDLKSIVGAAIEHAEHTEQVRAEALADGLTGVLNRRALDLAVGDLANQRFSAVMVDLDHFKSVNDTYGHQAGDELLHAVAQRILANVRPIDEVYRYGGEEFAIVMPETETATAGDIADRVRVALESSPFTIGPERTDHRATASLGVATGMDGQSVFARADEALYAAKHGGRNRVVVARAAPMPAPTADDLAAQPLR